jgi:uncharacterized protein (UPF0264 family)
MNPTNWTLRSGRPTRLLVSVRDADEARDALDAGADLIDVKEPARGSLGAADPDQIAAVLQAVSGRVPVSAALGELLESSRHTPSAVRSNSDRVGQGLPCPASTGVGLHYAKLGLAGCSSLPDWPQRWSAALKRLPAGIGAVAVVYADWRLAQSPQPRQVLAEAVRLGCQALLVDTFDKSRGPLLEHWPLSDLAPFVAEVRQQGLAAVLGGSLGAAEISALLPLAPDYVAVRGAVCHQTRTGRLDPVLVRKLRRLLPSLEPEAGTA